MNVSMNRRMKLFFAFFLSFVLVVSSFRVGYAGNEIVDWVSNLFNDKVNSFTTGIFSGFIPSLFDGPLIVLVGCNIQQLENIRDNAVPSCFKPITKSSGYNNGGLVQIAANTMQSAVDTPYPVNLATYFDGVKNESLIFKQAYAAEDTTYQRIFKMWEAIRNISFGLLAVITLIISIMISNRAKIDAQNVVTAQAMIPKIIIAAILITFSYAIGAIFINLVSLQGPLTNLSQAMVGRLYGSTSGTLNFIDPGDTRFTICSSNNLLNGKFEGFVSCAILAVINGALNAVKALGILAIIIVCALVLLILLLAMIFMYFTRYFKILLLVLLSPIIFVISILPGQEDKLKGWFLDMIGAVLGIPAMMFTILLGMFLFFSIGWIGNKSQDIFLVGNVWNNFIGFMILVMSWVYALKVPGMVENFVKGPPPKKK